MPHTTSLTHASHGSRVPALRALVLATVLVCAIPGWAAGTAHAEPRTPTQANDSWVGVFTGEYAKGAPVYRLPSVTVSVARKSALAQMERERRAMRAKQAQTKPAAPPA